MNSDPVGTQLLVFQPIRTRFITPPIKRALVRSFFALLSSPSITPFFCSFHFFPFHLHHHHPHLPHHHKSPVHPSFLRSPPSPCPYLFVDLFVTITRIHISSQCLLEKLSSSPSSLPIWSSSLVVLVLEAHLLPAPSVSTTSRHLSLATRTVPMRYYNRRQQHIRSTRNRKQEQKKIRSRSSSTPPSSCDLTGISLGGVGVSSRKTFKLSLFHWKLFFSGYHWGREIPTFFFFFLTRMFSNTSPTPLPLFFVFLAFCLCRPQLPSQAPCGQGGHVPR